MFYQSSYTTSFMSQRESKGPDGWSPPRTLSCLSSKGEAFGRQVTASYSQRLRRKAAAKTPDGKRHATTPVWIALLVPTSFPTYQVQADQDRNVPKVMPVMARPYMHI